MCACQALSRYSLSSLFYSLFLSSSFFHSTLSDYFLSFVFLSWLRDLYLCLSIFTFSFFSIFAHNMKWNLAFVLFIDSQTLHFTSLIMFSFNVKSFCYYYYFQHLNLRHNIFSSKAWLSSHLRFLVFLFSFFLATLKSKIRNSEIENFNFHFLLHVFCYLMAIVRH